jgi:two-component system phosphate regulon sensor histidine kinase PhoR
VSSAPTFAVEYSHMNKKRLQGIIALMSIALVGIIGVQIYWVKNAVQVKEAQFRNRVSAVLQDFSMELENEQRNWRVAKAMKPTMRGERRTILTTDSAVIIEHAVSDSNNRIVVKVDTIIKADGKKTSTMVYGNTETGEEDRFVISVGSENQDTMTITAEEIEASYQEVDQVMQEFFFEITAGPRSLSAQFSPLDFEDRLHERLASDGLNLPFQFAVIEGGFPSPLHSSKFEPKDQEVYRTGLFINDLFNPRSDLLVIFPDKTNYYIRSLWGVVLLSLLFTGVIVFVFERTIRTILNQKRLSQIKTDFINNMTHEFKTPIATIGLALDSINTSSIISDPEKIQHFTRIIREENARMHRQVESVLQVSQMERQGMELGLESVDGHELLDKACQQMQIQFSAREGQIKQEWAAEFSRIRVDEELMAHVWLNLLDNANKYSPEIPEVTIRTSNRGNRLIIEVEDHGQGMTKEQQKQVFDKFYRVTNGNIHDVKGHGLGLAYVREIVEAHGGEVDVRSELDKGSTFIVELPLEHE